MPAVVREDPTKTPPPADDPIRAAIETGVANLHEGGDDLEEGLADGGDTPPEEVVGDQPPADAVVETSAEVVADKPVVVDKPVADAAAAAAAAPKLSAADAAADALAKDLGLKAKDKHGRENKIPHSTVVGRLIPTAIKKAEVAWRETHVKPLEQKLQTYETRLESIGSTEALMFGTLEQKRQFLDQLASSVPGYRELLSGSAKPAAGDAKVETTAAVPDAANDPEPTPDAKDEAGKVIGWTEEGLAKLRAWDRRESLRLAESSLVKKYGLNKVADRLRTAETRETESAAMDAQLTQAQTWPGFVDNAQAILDVLAADKPQPTGRRYADGTPEMKCKHTLQTAYNQVLHGRATVDRTALEAELTEKIREELSRAPRSTSAAGASGASAAERVAASDEADAAMDPTERAIRTAVRQLKR